MATLRAAAFILNGLLLLLVLFMALTAFGQSDNPKPSEMLRIILFLATPAVSIVTIALLSRPKTHSVS